MNTEMHSKDTRYNSRNKSGMILDDAVKETVHDIGKKVGDTASQVANTTVGRYQMSRMYVKKHPVTGVVAAAALGMALGSVLTAAMRKSV